MSGKLKFYYGTVGSGKTCYLLNVCFNYENAGWKVLTIKPSTDTRSCDIETRAGIPARKVNITIKPDESLKAYEEPISKADVILVDECQFLTETQVKELRNISFNFKLDVLCFGLRTDSDLNLFPASAVLMALSDELIEVKTICSVCGHHASFNKKVKGDKDKIIDCGWDTFTQTCWEHYQTED